MPSKDRISYTTTLNKQILKKIKLLAIHEEAYENEILEEAMTDIYNKYAKKHGYKDINNAKRRS